MVAGRRQRVLVALAALVLLSAFVGVTLGVTAGAVSAYDGWGHDGAAQCVDCHHEGQPLDDSLCTKFCHFNFKSFPGKQCWSCHFPGQDTAPFSTRATPTATPTVTPTATPTVTPTATPTPPVSPCSQACHLWDQAARAYTIPFTHGLMPHDGASGYGKTCLDCHETSVAFNDPNGSPHHSGQTTPPPTCESCHNGTDAVFQETHDNQACTNCHTGMNIPPVPLTCNKCHAAETFGTPNCLTCHVGQVHNTNPQAPSCSNCHGDAYKKHAGKVACLTCHTGIAAFHHGQSKTTTQRNCRSCHAKRHAGKNVPQSKCATCHKGTGTGPAAKAQHSTNVTKSRVCSACHSQRLHASRAGSGITSCATCHKGKYHAGQRTPPNSVCTRCHGRAARHTNGYSCSLCHRSDIHNVRPAVVKIRP